MAVPQRAVKPGPGFPTRKDVFGCGFGFFFFSFMGFMPVIASYVNYFLTGRGRVPSIRLRLPYWWVFSSR